MNGKISKIAAALVILTTPIVGHAKLPPMVNTICPAAQLLHCKSTSGNCTADDSEYCSGTWQGTNQDGKLFASRTDIDCHGTVISWLANASELVDGYKIKCVYELQDAFGVKYKINLYNEKGYELDSQGNLVLRQDND